MSIKRDCYPTLADVGGASDTLVWKLGLQYLGEKDEKKRVMGAREVDVYVLRRNKMPH